MADTDQLTASDTAAAEKAYAAASAEKAALRKSAEAEPVAVEVTPVVDAAPKPAPVAAPAPAPVAVAKAAPAPKPRKVVAKAPAKPAAAKPVKPVPAAKTEAKKVARKVAVKAGAAKATIRSAAKKAERKPVMKSLMNPSTLISKLKDTKMATKTKQTTEDFTARVQGAVKDAQGRVQDAVKEVQGRAKTALEKSQALLSDAGDFTKGNVEAIVESGKILGKGFQSIGKNYVENAKSTVATVQEDVKEFRTVKSPTEFVKLQGTLVRKYFDTAVANSSKNREAALKLANDAFRPISNRVSLAVEKVKKTEKVKKAA